MHPKTLQNSFTYLCIRENKAIQILLCGPEPSVLYHYQCTIIPHKIFLMKRKLGLSDKEMSR